MIRSSGHSSSRRMPLRSRSRHHRRRPEQRRDLARQRPHHAAHRRPARRGRLLEPGHQAQGRDRRRGGQAVPEVDIRWGTFINVVIAFIVVASVVFMIGRSFIKEEPAAPTKTCPFCKEANAVDATQVPGLHLRDLRRVSGSAIGRRPGRGARTSGGRGGRRRRDRAVRAAGRRRQAQRHPGRDEAHEPGRHEDRRCSRRASRGPPRRARRPAPRRACGRRRSSRRSGRGAGARTASR